MEKRVFILAEHNNDEYEIDFEMDGYTHLRAFHACRPLRIDDYLNNGITPICYESALQEIKTRIVCERVSETEAITKLDQKWSHVDCVRKRVWLQMNKNLLLNEAGHYLIYGSELINELSMNLHCRDRLKVIGIPTIFYCDIPIDDISTLFLSDIQNRINEGDTSDIGLSVEYVEPSSIIDYEHPTKRMIDIYGGSYMPDYKCLKELGYVSDKIIV